MAAETVQEIVRLAQQLTPEQRREVMDQVRQLNEDEMHELINISKERELTLAEQLRLLDLMVLPGKPGINFSDRREDWYDDDGR